jgi:excisionase family DNA binding protein
MSRKIFLRRYSFNVIYRGMATLTTQQAAERLGVTIRRVNALIKSGRLPAEKFGQVYMIKESDLKLVSVRKPGRPSKKKGAKSKR